MASESKATVLVVDDEKTVRQQVEKLLREGGYHVLSASNGKDALTMVRQHQPDLVLLDVIMPGIDGMEVCRILKNRSDENFLPVILLTAKNDLESRVTGLKLGADDYMAKPAAPRELMARIEALLRIKELQNRASALAKSVEDRSVTDELTGLYNERYLENRLSDEFKRAERYSEPLSFISIESSGLDTVERQYGKEAAEAALQEIAGILRSGIRDFDVVVRRNENQFVILLPRTHFTGSLSVATRIWQRVQDYPFLCAGHRLRIGVSMGVSFFPNKDVTSAEQLMAHANEALDKARKAGPNKVCLYQHTTYFFRPEMGD